MPLFSDPRDPPGLRQSGRLLLESGAALLALFGWSTVAFGLARHGAGPAALAGAGFVAAVVQRSFFRATLSLEVILLAAAFAYLPQADLEWAYAGAVLIVGGRSLAFARRRLAEGG
jgi:hypothetical protein